MLMAWLLASRVSVGPGAALTQTRTSRAEQHQRFRRVRVETSVRRPTKSFADADLSHGVFRCNLSHGFGEAIPRRRLTPAAFHGSALLIELAHSLDARGVSPPLSGRGRKVQGRGTLRRSNMDTIARSEAGSTPTGFVGAGRPQEFLNVRIY